MYREKNPLVKVNTDFYKNVNKCINHPPLKETDLIQQSSSQLERWRSAECSECVSGDCSVKTPASEGPVAALINIPGYNKTMKTKERSKRLREKVNEGISLGTDTKTFPCH